MGSGVTQRQLGPSSGGREASAGWGPTRSTLDAGAGQADMGTRAQWLSEATPRCLAMQSRLSPQAALTHSHLTKLSLKWVGAAFDRTQTAFLTCLSPGSSSVGLSIF